MRRAIAVADIEDAEMLMMLDADELSGIQWTDQGEPKHIPMAAIMKVTLLRNWRAAQAVQSPDMYFELTAASFLDYMRNVVIWART